MVEEGGFDIPARSWFAISDVDEKVRRLPEALGFSLALSEVGFVPEVPARDLKVQLAADLPDKPGLGSIEGQARLLHDLANIELQAMELAVRTLHEFPEAPSEFKQQLAEIAHGEGRHLKLCLEALDHLGFQWGDWDVHLSLWNTVSRDDDLLDRIVTVHRYLEGSGLDAGDSILRRLTGAGSKLVREVVKVIVREEVDHVLFGSLWYRKIAESKRLDPERDFTPRLERVARLAPRRDRLARELRLQAGFTEYELQEIARVQNLK